MAGVLTTLRVCSKVFFAPVWLGWHAYRALWWAFDDSDTRRAVGASATLAPHDDPPPPNPLTDAPRFGESQHAAFEVTDSTPPPPKAPTGPLVGGYVATLAFSLAAGLLAMSLTAGESMSTGRGWILWGWATLMATVASLYVVRHVARRRDQAKPATWWASCKATAGGLKDACVGAGHGVGAACAKGATVAKAAREHARRAAASTPAQTAKRGVISAWHALRKKAAPPTPAPAPSPSPAASA